MNSRIYHRASACYELASMRSFLDEALGHLPLELQEETHND